VVPESRQVEQSVQQWLQNVVVGLELCPFAKQPFEANRVRFQVSDATNEEHLLLDIQQEISLLDGTPSDEIETTLLILPYTLADFSEYNQFLGLVDDFLEAMGWMGEYQIASFHPHYQFAGTEPEDSENLTNRSPYPILHLLREASLDWAVASHPDTGQIPEKNIARMRNLSDQQQQQYFSYLYSKERLS